MPAVFFRESDWGRGTEARSTWNLKPPLRALGTCRPRDPAAIAAKLPAATLHGTFTGRLDNSVGQIALTEAFGEDIKRFT